MYRLIFKQTCENLRQNKKYAGFAYRNYNNTRVQPLEAGFGKLLLILSPFAIGGGVVSYAKYDPEFRKTLEKNVPTIGPVLEMFIDDKNPFADFQKKIDQYTSSITGIFGGSSEKPKEEPKPAKKIERPEPVKQAAAAKSAQPQNVVQSVPAPPISKPSSSVPAPPQTSSPPAKSEQPKVVPTSVPMPEKVVKPATPELPKNIADLEKSVEKAALTAVQEYNKVVNILKGYNDDVKKIVDSAVENVDPSSWVALKNKTFARDNAVKTAEQAATQARAKLEELEKQLDKDVVEFNEELKSSLKNKISLFYDHLNNAKSEVFKAKELAGLSENYWRKVDAARSYFVQEIESLFGVNLNDRKLNLSKEDVDLFLINAYSHVMAYQKELQKLQTEGDLRLKRALDAVRGTDNNEAVRAQLQYELDKEKTKLYLQNQSKIVKIKAEAEKSLRDQLKKQIEAHTDHLQDSLEQKEIEMRRVFNRELDEKIANERASYNTQLASMLGKLKGMDSALKERADAEKSAHQAQSLWAACQNLWASVRTGQPGKTWREELRPLNNEIRAVGMAGEGDDLVGIVINSLPDQAKSRGVYPEEALRERFVNVENVARRVALVPAEGARLPVYFLSFIQAALIARPANPISEDEVANEEFDFSKLDTYDILNRARYFLDRGDLVQTLKYMNLLQGASRKVSSEWLQEARLLLETQQAVNILMAHATANGLRYL